MSNDEASQSINLQSATVFPIVHQDVVVVGSPLDFHRAAQPFLPFSALQRLQSCLLAREDGGCPRILHFPRGGSLEGAEAARSKEGGTPSGITWTPMGQFYIKSWGILYKSPLPLEDP